MSQGILIFQAIVTIACIAFVLAAGIQKSNRLSKLMLIVAFLCLIENAAYLMEIQADSISAVLLIMKLRYIGVAFIDTFFLLFCMRYTHKKIPKHLVGVMLVVDILVMISAWTSQYHSLFYRDIYYVTAGSLTYLHRVYGPVIYFNSVYETVQIFACAYLALKGWREAKDEKYRRSCKMLFFCVLLPFVVVPIRLSGLDRGYELIPSLTAVGMILFFSSAMVQDMFDIARVAHNNIFENMHEPIIIVDGNYGFVEANIKAKKLFPSLADQRQGQLLTETKLLSYLRTGIANKMYLGDQVYDVHIDQIYEEDVLMGYSILLMDLTDEERQMKRIQSLVTAANEANQAKSDFIASMSHELRTPINSIMGMNEMILREAKDPQILQYGKDVESAANMLLSLVNDILDSSKLSTGKLNILPVHYDLGNMISDLYQMLSPHAKKKNLTFQVVVDPTLPRAYIGDDIRIRQVLINLLTNAIKYTAQGSVTFYVESVQTTDSSDLGVRFSIKDTGNGIKPEKIPQIYERFNRVEETAVRHIEGSGLGLSISSSLLQLMGSKLDVWSQEGVGSDFSFVLYQPVADPTPIGEFAQMVAQNVAYEEFASGFVAPKAKILLVDDNEMNRRVFVELLKESRIQITEADSGAECLRLTKEHAYDLIFLDHMMPEMDGIETRRNMLSDEGNLCRQVPIVMLTANVTAGAREKYLAEGFCDFLPKPILYDQLEKMLLTYLPKDLVKKGQKDDKDQAQADMELPQIEEFDAEYAMLIWKSPSRYRTGLQEFARDLARAQEKLTTLFDTTWTDETKENYRRCIHTLKGTAATVGALLLSKTARLIEIALADGRIDQVQTLHPILMEQIEDAGKHLADYFKDHKDTTAETKENLLEMMQSALENQDLQAVDFLYQQLQDRAWSVDAASVLATLGQDLSEFSWESATRKVEILRTFC